MSSGRRARSFPLRLHSVLRWLHTYLSLASLAVVLFFAATGVTLNHPDWFAGQARQIRRAGRIPVDWLSASVDKLAVAERLRSEHGLRGTVDEFRVDDAECMVSFKAPGFAADAFIRRDTGEATVEIVDEGAGAFLNDLHKARHTGPAWAAAVDVAGVALAVLSLTGFGLVFFLKRVRLAGLLAAVAGAIVLVLAVRLCLA